MLAVARDIEAHALPRREGGHVVVVFLHAYYKRKLRAVITSPRSKPRREATSGAWEVGAELAATEAAMPSPGTLYMRGSQKIEPHDSGADAASTSSFMSTSC